MSLKQTLYYVISIFLSYILFSYILIFFNSFFVGLDWCHSQKRNNDIIAALTFIGG